MLFRIKYNPYLVIFLNRSCLSTFIISYMLIRHKHPHSTLNILILPFFSPIFLGRIPDNYKRWIIRWIRWIIRWIRIIRQNSSCQISTSHFHVDCVFSPQQRNSLLREMSVSILTDRESKCSQKFKQARSDSVAWGLQSRSSRPHSSSSLCYPRLLLMSVWFSHAQVMYLHPPIQLNTKCWNSTPLWMQM